MSAEAVGFVYRHSPFKGATLAVHLAVADSVNDQYGNEFFMLNRELQKKARVKRTAAKEGLDQLCDHKPPFLELIEDGGGAGVPSTYRFLWPEVPVVFDGRRKRVAKRPVSEREGRAAERPLPTSENGREATPSDEKKGHVAAEKGHVAANAPITRTQRTQDSPSESARPDFVGRFVDACRVSGHDPLTSLRNRAAGVAARAFAEGKPAEIIHAALAECARRRTLGAFANIVADLESGNGIGIGPAPRAARSVPTTHANLPQVNQL